MPREAPRLPLRGWVGTVGGARASLTPAAMTTAAQASGFARRGAVSVASGAAGPGGFLFLTCRRAPPGLLGVGAGRPPSDFAEGAGAGRDRPGSPGAFSRVSAPQVA